ncbi:acyl transferase/acyl hydrolase/lysophospholipase [Xylariaceae sp. FL0662B]|nr:acyl transferase/acyl hydrolase/lysophospholipase [Xylariaceae sp. FL0662B]
MPLNQYADSKDKGERIRNEKSGIGAEDICHRCEKQAYYQNAESHSVLVRRIGEIRHNSIILPAAVVGHSSGEIAAGYTAGALSLESACKVASFRGKTVDKLVSINKALENPGSSADAIQALKLLLDQEGIFAKQLNTGVAYHSCAMEIIADEYLGYLGTLESPPDKGCLLSPCMVSTVTGSIVTPVVLRDPKHWVDNLVSLVQFSESVRKLTRDKTLVASLLGTDTISDFIDIGPHGSLKRAVDIFWDGALSTGIQGSPEGGIGCPLKLILGLPITSSAAVSCVQEQALLLWPSKQSGNLPLKMGAQVPEVPYREPGLYGRSPWSVGTSVQDETEIELQLRPIRTTYEKPWTNRDVQIFPHRDGHTTECFSTRAQAQDEETAATYSPVDHGREINQKIARIQDHSQKAIKFCNKTISSQKSYAH